MSLPWILAQRRRAFPTSHHFRLLHPSLLSTDYGNAKYISQRMSFISKLVPDIRKKNRESICPYVSILPTGMYLVNPSHLEINQLGIFPAGNIAHWLSTGLPCIRVLNSIPSFGKQEKRKKTNSWAWQCTSVIPALWRPRQGQLGLPAGNGNWEQRVFYL